MTDINNIVQTEMTTEQIRKEKLKEYRRNYYREYCKRNPEYRASQRDNKAKSNRIKYAESEEFRKKANERSKECHRKKNIEIKDKLAKLELLEKIIGNNFDIENSKISVKS
jgi:hypothetical protein